MRKHINKLNFQKQKLNKTKKEKRHHHYFYRTGTFSLILKEARMITAFFVQLILIRKKKKITYTGIASSLTPINIRWHQPIRTSQESARDTRLGLKSVTLKYGIETFVVNRDFSRRHPVCHFASVNFCIVVNGGTVVCFVLVEGFWFWFLVFAAVPRDATGERKIVALPYCIQLRYDHGRRFGHNQCSFV